MLIGFAGLEDTVRKLRLVGRVWEFLSFKTECSSLIREEIARIELQARLIRDDLHDPAADRVVKDGGSAELLAVVVANHPAVIVASRDFERFEILFDPLPDCGGAGEIHGSVCDRGFFPGGDETRVGGKEGVGHEL